MRILRLAGCFVAAIVAVATPVRSSFVDTFEGGVNRGGWHYTDGGDALFPGGGNPGWCLVASTTIQVPRPQTAPLINSPFKGNYRAMGVTEVGVDLTTWNGPTAAGRPLTLFLYTDSGTPGEPNDDWGAYHVGSSNVPVSGQGWRSFDFAVPSQATSLPPGWRLVGPAPLDWNSLITNVAQVRFFYGDPQRFYVEEQWSMALDNARIVTNDPAPAPGRIDPSSLRGDRISPEVVRLTWGPSPCGLAAEDYGIYEGALGEWFSHTAVDCHDDAGDFTEDVTTGAGDRYLLVVPFNASVEGSYGVAADETERPRGVASCAPERSILTCP